MYSEILVTGVSPMDMHRSNNGQNQFGNASSIKRRPDGRVYISGQMQRHAFFEAIGRLDESEDTHVSNGDATSYQISKDLRADLGGFMITSIKGDPGRRTSPVSATPAVALEKSETVRDLLIRLRTNMTGSESEDDNNSQNLATQEISQADRMRWSFSLDCEMLSSSKRFEFVAHDGERGMHVDTEYVRHASLEEKTRRALLYLKATRHLNDYASQARNMASGEPQRVLIVLDSVHSRKAARYFQLEETARKALLEELEARGATYFLADGRDTDKLNVAEAYSQAAEAIEENGIVDHAEKQMTYPSAFEIVEEMPES